MIAGAISPGGISMQSRTTRHNPTRHRRRACDTAAAVIIPLALRDLYRPTSSLMSKTCRCASAASDSLLIHYLRLALVAASLRGNYKMT